MIYLSWSIIQLIVVLFMLTAAMIASIIYIRFKKKPACVKYALTGWASLVTLTFALALDVGTRQSDLKRNRFDSQVSESIDKVESDRKTVNDVKQTFESKLTEGSSK